MDTHTLKKAAARARGEQRTNAQIPTATQTAREFLEKYGTLVREAMGETEDDKKATVRLVAHLINVIASNPNLIRAVHESPDTLMGAILQSIEVGLTPNNALQLCFLVPYREKDKVASAREGKDIWKYKVSFQLGYQGALRLTYNSGEVLDVDAIPVYEKDYLDWQLGTNKHLIHRPCMDEDAGKVIAYYAIVNFKSGGTRFRVWSAAKAHAHAVQYSKSWNSKYAKFLGPWADNFDSMACKSVLLDVLKYAPKSAKLSTLLAADTTTKSVSASSRGLNALLLPNEDYSSQGERAESEAAEGDTEAQKDQAMPEEMQGEQNSDRTPEEELLEIR